MNIIAVDDELDALQALERAIKRAETSATVTCFDSSKQALEYAENHSVAVAFLDIEMHEMDGVTLAKRLQNIHKQTNIIFVTGFGEYMEAALGLRVSGYVFKPINPARVREELDNLRHPPDALNAVESIGGFVFENTSRRVLRDKQDLLLTPREYDIFHFLAGVPNEFITPQELYAKAFGQDAGPDVRALYAHISNLRKKLGLDGEKTGNDIEIEHIRGKGYKLTTK